MTDYQPGTVAVATVRGVPNVRVMRNVESWGPVWTSAVPITTGDLFRHYEQDVTDVRPLVVLDPDDFGEDWRRWDELTDPVLIRDGIKAQS